MQNVIRLALPLFIMAAACGSDGDGPSKPSVSESASAKDISASDATALCKYVGNLLDITPTKQQTCTVGAAIVTKDKASCEAAAAQCVKQPDQKDDGSPSDNSSDDCSKASDDLKDCSATVGEIESCFESYRNQLKAALDTTCDDAGKITQDDLTAAPNDCTTLMQKCPKLFADDSNAQSGGDTVSGNGG